MAELYTTGINRIVYKAEGFGAGLTVEAYFWNPLLVRSVLQTFTEIELGLYYLDYDFEDASTHIGLFYENDVAKAFGVFRVTEIPAQLTTIEGYVDELETGEKPKPKANFSV